MTFFTPPSTSGTVVLSRKEGIMLSKDKAQEVSQVWGQACFLLLGNPQFLHAMERGFLGGSLSKALNKNLVLTKVLGLLSLLLVAVYMRAGGTK